MENIMTDREEYNAGQEASGIKPGDKVRATRHFDEDEDGSQVTDSRILPIKGRFVDDGAVGVVHEVVTGLIGVDCGKDYGGLWSFPYTVLEIVKKADGSVPDAKPITKGDSNMKNSRFDIEIVKEKTDDKGKTTNGIVVKQYRKWHVDAIAAIEYAKMKHGIAILEQQEAGFEVDILVHPFCG